MAVANRKQEMQTQQIKKRERAEFGFARKEGEANAVAHPEHTEAGETVEPAPAEANTVTSVLPVSMLLD